MHSAQELAELSSLVHNVLGWLLVALGVVRIAELVRGVPAGPARFVWPTLGLVIGFGLTVFVFFHQIYGHGLGPFDDPLQNLHQAIGLIAGLGSVAEVAWRLKGGRWLEGGFPLALVGVGVAFLLHEQHTTEALIVHWALAATLVASGLASLSAILSGEEARSMRTFGVLLLVGAAAQLAVYEEDPGAHAPSPASEHQGH